MQDGMISLLNHSKPNLVLSLTCLLNFNYQKKISKLALASLFSLIHEFIGPIVRPPKKSEINQPVDHAGLLVLLRLCQIDYVSFLVRSFKFVCLRKIY